MKIRDARVIVCSPGRNYVTLRIETEMLLGDRVAPLDLIVIVEHRDAVRRRLDRLNEARMLLLDLAHLRVPPLREFVQPVIDFAPDAERARHLAVDRRFEQTPQALHVIRDEETLHGQHDHRESERDAHARECTDRGADRREQREGHDRTRPDDVHVVGESE